MSQFIAEESFWNLFPNATLGVVLLKGIKNDGEVPQELKALL